MSETYSLTITDSGSVATGLTPTFGSFRNVLSGAAITPETISEIGNGHYKFVVNWDAAKYSGVEKVVFTIDAGAGIAEASERFIHGEITKFDNAHELTNNISATLDTVASNVVTALSKMNQTVDVLVGKWEIADNQLKFYDSSGLLTNTFDLFDADGEATSQQPYSRVPTT